MNNLLSSKYDREAWIDFLQSKLMPNDFKLKRQTINIAFRSRCIKPQAYWIGDCSSMDDLAVIEISHASEHDPRIGVSRDAFRLMAELNISKALFFFTSDNSNNYRFSLITLELKLVGTDVKYSFSNPKRFSYYLGEDAKIKTPANFLINKERIRDFEDLQNRFSVEVVNKEFYLEIQRMFFRLVGGKIRNGNKEREYEPLLKLPGDPGTKSMQEFSVRLIGRLVFCWFLKKKLSDRGNPLIPHALLSVAAVKDSFYHHVLEPLFFEVLNTPLEQRHSFFRTDLYDNIPFLNGGLFDPSQHQDYYNPSNAQRAALTSWSLKIPDDWFRELFCILETYNFTIDENTSIDIDLSVDPEMLGRIFENLLAELNPETGETARNTTGSFYTPRAIVEYMVDQSLILYLANNTDIPEPLLRDLLDYNSESTELSKTRKLAVIDALDCIKVIDPACGSGAFPIGILQKMLLILHKVDPDSIEWVTRQLDKIPNLLVRNELKEKLMQENWKYKHKMGIIQNAVYGVDIQSIATEISKLRLFLSLIVDETVIETKANKNIHPLPNLAFKFVTANSLIALGEKTETIIRFQNIIKGFDNIRERYMHSHSAVEKAQVREDFAKLNASLMYRINPQSLTQSNFLDEPEQIEIKFEQETYLFRLLSWDPFQDKASDWFDPKWMFGIKDGFDIVIGNPPYIQLQKACDDNRKFADIYKNCGYESFERTGDIYCLFYERGKQILKPGGHLCYITSNKWMRANYGKSLRKFLATNTQTKVLIDFGGFKVFDSATVDTNIMIFKNSAPGNSTGIACSIKPDYLKGNSLAQYVEDQGIPMPEYSQESWIISDGAAQKLKAKIERIGTPLKDWDVSINYGVKTGCNEAFIISGAKKDELIAADPRSADIIKPILRGRDIKRYRTEFADNWLIVTHNGYIDNHGNSIPRVNIDDYPTIKKHLDGYWDKVEKRADQGSTPYNLRICAYMGEFEREKLVYPETTSTNSFNWDQEGILLEKTGFMLRSRYAKFILGVFNSNFFLFVYRKLYSSVELGSKGYQFNKHALEKYPIPKVTDSEQIVLEEIVNMILKEKQNNKNTLFLEAQIDIIVYKLYDLNYSEAKLIDPDFDSVLASFGLLRRIMSG